jgi:putative ABC transport system permease protein
MRIAPVALVRALEDLAVQGAERRVATSEYSSRRSEFLAVLIASVGIAGVLAFAVGARTNEIGTRMSLGADSGPVQRMILKEGGALVAIGLALGVTGAFFSAGVMRGLLFGVAPHDPTTFVGVGVSMAAVGIIACWIPALRAARIDLAIAMQG